MVSQAQGGRQGSVFFQTTLMGCVSTHQIQTPPQRRRKLISLPSSDSTRSQRRRLCTNNPDFIPITFIPLVEQLSQHDLQGHNQQAVDGDTFGDAYPSSPSLNSSIFTFQNIGPQKQSATDSKSQLNSSRFSRGKASIFLCAEHCLNEAKLPHCDTFNLQIKSSSKQSFSYILTNKHEAPAAGQHLVGDTGFTICSLFCSQKPNHGIDSTGLGRWSLSHFQGRGQQPCVCMLHTAQSKIHVIRDRFGINTAGISYNII